MVFSGATQRQGRAVRSLVLSLFGDAEAGQEWTAPYTSTVSVMIFGVGSGSAHFCM